MTDEQQIETKAQEIQHFLFSPLRWDQIQPGLQDKYRELARHVLTTQQPVKPEDADTVFGILEDKWYSAPGGIKTTLTEMAEEIVARYGPLPSPVPAELPLPVGMIVVGKGLTEEQKNHNEERSKLNAEVALEAAKSLEHAFSWYDTQEGHNFWENVTDRLYDMSEAFRANAEAKRIPEPAEKAFNAYHLGSVNWKSSHDDVKDTWRRVTKAIQEETV